MTQAEIFDAFMHGIWNTAKPEDYNKFHDAAAVARAMGAQPDGPQVNDAGIGDNGSGWLFPDGSTIRIVTDVDGVGCGVAYVAV